MGYGYVARKAERVDGWMLNASHDMRAAEGKAFASRKKKRAMWRAF